MRAASETCCGHLLRIASQGPILGAVVSPSHLSRMLTAEQVAEQLGGLVSAHQLRKLARQGRVSGAVKVAGRVFFDRRTAAWLLVALDGQPQIGPDGKPRLAD